MEILRIVVLLALAFVLVFAAFILLPRYLVRSSLRTEKVTVVERLKAENDARRLLFEASAVVLALLAFYFTFNELSATREELKLNQDTQRLERFTAAVEQLGSSNPTVQIAGIHGVDAIAAAEPSFRPVVEETLAAFLRLQAPCDPPHQPCPPRTAGADPAVQTAITVLGQVDSDMRRTQAGSAQGQPQPY